MLKKKQAGMPLPIERPSAPPQNVVNRMDALRRSIAHDGAVSYEEAHEMLLPFSGKGKEKPAAKREARPARRKAS